MTSSLDRKSELDSMFIAVGGIWAAVLAISLLSPDMVSGSEQQRMPIAAFSTWIWGLVATAFVFSFWTRMRGLPHRAELHRPLALGVALVWGAAALVSVLSPEMVTGSDPTRIPVASFVAPVAATVLTFLARAAVELVGSVIDEDATT